MENTLIDWNQSSGKIEAGIPCAAVINGQLVGISRGRAGGTMSAYRPGTITRCDEQLWVQCGQGHLVIEAISANGIDYSAAEFCMKHNLRAGDSFDDTKEHKHAA
jgi:methionyl-tRNA formyltransferase